MAHQSNIYGLDFDWKSDKDLTMNFGWDLHKVVDHHMDKS